MPKQYSQEIHFGQTFRLKPYDAVDDRASLDWIITDVGESASPSFLATPIYHNKKGKPLIAPGGSIYPQNVAEFKNRWGFRRITAAIRRNPMIGSREIRDWLVKDYERVASQRPLRRITWKA